MTGPAAELLGRLDRVTARLEGLRDAEPAPGALTDLDLRRNERWEWGQVWAHLAEFPDYWIGEVIGILAQGDLVAFGRVQSDTARLAAIELDRTTPVAELWSRIEPALDRVRDLVENLTAEDWSLRGTHSTLGVMPMPRIVEEFLMGHLEAHADQLDGLLATPS